MFFNFRFQNTQNKPFSRQITLVGGGQLYPLNTFPVSKSILKTFVGSYGDFFDEMTLKIAKFISFQKERNFAILSVISSKKCP